MTDVRTEIKAIKEELQAIENQCLEDWTTIPSAPSTTQDPPTVPQEPSSQTVQTQSQSSELQIQEPMAVSLPSDIEETSPATSVHPLHVNLPSCAETSAGVVSTVDPVTAFLERAEQRFAVGNSFAAGHSLNPPSSPNLNIPSFFTAQERYAETTVGSLFDEKLRDLDTQAEYVNHLAEQQVTALLKLKAIAEAAEFEAIRTGIIDGHSGSGSSGWLHHHQSATVSFVELDPQGCWVITSKPVDWLQPERDASAAAEQLRNLQKRRSRPAQAPVAALQPEPLRANRAEPRMAASSPNRSDSHEPTLSAILQQWFEQITSKLQHHTARLERRSRIASARLGRLSPLTSSPPAKQGSRRSSDQLAPSGVQFQVFALWIAGAAAVRISLNILAAVAPGLVPLAIIGFVGVGGWVAYRLLLKQAH